MATVFPLNIEEKIDYPAKVAQLEGVDSKYFETAEEKNKKTKAIEENNSLIKDIVGKMPLTISIDGVLFLWSKNPTNATDVLQVSDVISNGRISQDVYIYSAIYNGSDETDFGTLQNNFTDGSYKDVIYEDYNDVFIELSGSVVENNTNVYDGSFLIEKGQESEVITLQFDVVAPDDNAVTNVYLDSVDNGVYLSYDTPTLTTTLNLDLNGSSGSPITIENQLKLTVTIVSRSSGKTEGVGTQLIIDTNNI